MQRTFALLQSPEGRAKLLNPRTLATLLLLLVALAVCVVAIRQVVPLGFDWVTTYSTLPGIWQAPYTNENFTNPPWVTFVLPHALLPVDWGNAVNFLLNIAVPLLVIFKYRGGPIAILLTFTSPMMIDLARVNNIDWLPLATFLLPAQWGLPLLLLKPQILGGAALIWWKKHGFSLRMLLPSLIIVALSFLIWGLWFQEAGLLPFANIWNFAPFPIGIPFGIYIIYLAWRDDDEILGAAATPFFSPYVAHYSLSGLVALLACRYPRAAFCLSFGFWWYTIVTERRFS